jgi:hypothetical protein
LNNLKDYEDGNPDVEKYRLLFEKMDAKKRERYINSLSERLPGLSSTGAVRNNKVAADTPSFIAVYINAYKATHIGHIDQ